MTYTAEIKVDELAEQAADILLALGGTHYCDPAYVSLNSTLSAIYEEAESLGCGEEKFDGFVDSYLYA
jgi:hypothetical protein